MVSCQNSYIFRNIVIAMFPVEYTQFPFPYTVNAITYIILGAGAVLSTFELGNVYILFGPLKINCLAVYFICFCGSFDIFIIIQ